MKPQEIIESTDPAGILTVILKRIHEKGPVRAEDMEILACLKIYHPSVLSKYEESLTYLLGLFYKTTKPAGLLGYAYSVFKEGIHHDTGIFLTPVQASIRMSILRNRYFSFSAPTSSGKSFLLRKLIEEEGGDVMIVVPSRALIAEYLLAVNDIVGQDASILVLQFIDDINRAKTRRRVFVVTPERASEIFRYPKKFYIGLFIYDEAHISEEKVRGVTFDALVRRIDRTFPVSRKVFAHPFVTNPGAQFAKHRIEGGENREYRQHSVGKVFLKPGARNGEFWQFSPYSVDAHLKPNMVKFGNDPVEERLRDGGSVLVFVSKKSIYDRKFIETFGRYIYLCPVVDDPEALAIIDQVEEIIGAENRRSDLVALMRRGVVVHHGSVPLSVRFLLERFTRAGFTRICFATSTLLQGINMPFDIVWVDNFRFLGSEEEKVLGLKNLVGRAGRTTTAPNTFEYGYVVVANANVKAFVERFTAECALSEKSQLDQPADPDSPFDQEFVEAVKDGTLNDLYDLPETKLDRLRSVKTEMAIEAVLDALFTNDVIISGTAFSRLEKPKRDTARNAFKTIFAESIGRILQQGEQAVLSTAVAILLWRIEGRSFRELLALRYSYVAKLGEQRAFKSLLRSGKITADEYVLALEELPPKFSAIPSLLPNANLKGAVSTFAQTISVRDINYDLLVYDTYDYIDKVISFSLSKVYIAAFDTYHHVTEDLRAAAMVNYFKYGTNDPIEIMLLRYGFTHDDFDWLKPHVIAASEEQLEFAPTVRNLEDSKLARIQQYM